MSDDPVVVNVAGFSPVKIDLGQGEGLQTLGYTRDGSRIMFHGLFDDYMADSTGGEGGSPAEIIYLSEIAVVRLLLTKFDPNVAAALRPRVAGGNDGQVVSSGTLMFTGELAGSPATYRVLINSPNDPYNFLRCVLREPHESNRGTKYSEWSLAFTAYPNGATPNVLFNRVTI